MPKDTRKPRDPHRVKLGDAIKDARTARGCSSQKELAGLAKIAVRRVAGAELGEDDVTRATWVAIGTVFNWPLNTLLAYVNGDIQTLDALPAQGPLIEVGTPKKLAELGLTAEITPPLNPDCVESLRSLRNKQSNDWEFFRLVDEWTRSPSAKGTNETE